MGYESNENILKLLELEKTTEIINEATSDEINYKEIELKKKSTEKSNDKKEKKNKMQNSDKNKKGEKNHQQHGKNFIILILFFTSRK
jgi:hypothetical protein